MSQECLEHVAQAELGKRGVSLDEQAKLSTPRFLGIDEYAPRKGQRYDTMLCELEHRHVLDVCAGRKQTGHVGLLERLSDCDAVEAGSQDMSETFRGAVQLCLTCGTDRGRSLPCDPACGQSRRPRLQSSGQK